MRLFDKTKVPFLQSALDAYAMRQKVIASNISNINTIGYKAQHLSFEDQLAGAIGATSVPGARTDPRHIPLGASAFPSAVAEVKANADDPSNDTDPLASGVNDVDIDNEMAELAKNQIRFKFASKLIGETFRGIQKSIRGQV